MTTYDIYRQAKQQPDIAGVVALVHLTGLSTEQIKQAIIHLDKGYVQIEHETYPLSRQAIDLLRYATTLDTTEIAQRAEQLAINENTAHHALAHALWETSSDRREITDFNGMLDFSMLPLAYVYPFSVASQLDPRQTDTFAHSRETLQTAVDWLLNESAQPQDIQSLLSKLLDGKLVFLVISTGVSGLNLVHNLIMGRLLSPEAYGQMTFFITLLLIVGLIPTAMQTVSARYSAVYSAQENHGLLYRLWQYGTQRGWLIGLIIAIALLIASPVMAEIFQIRSVWLFVPVALGIPFFTATGTERGLLQGTERYYWLSGAYLIEAVIRLGLGVILALLLMNANRALDGAVWAIGQSLILTWLIAWLGLRREPLIADDDSNLTLSDEDKAWLSLFGFTGMALLGQAIITNSDFILVKTFFDSFDAGLYASVSVIGRIVYFGTLPLTILIVPLVARKQALGESTRTLFLLLMGSGVVLCGGLIGMSVLFAPTILQLLYGEAYLSAAYLLPIYTVAAALFVLTNLLVTYRVALGKGTETWMPLLAGIAQIIGVILFHDSLQQIIIVQIIVMSVLFLGVAWRARR